MDSNNIIECYLTGNAIVTNNTVYIDVREVNNDDVVFNLDSTTFNLSIDGSFKRIKECIFNEYTGYYELTPNLKFINARFVVVQLYNHIDLVAIAKVGNNLYRGVSCAIYVE